VTTRVQRADHRTRIRRASPTARSFCETRPVSCFAAAPTDPPRRRPHGGQNFRSRNADGGSRNCAIRIASRLKLTLDMTELWHECQYYVIYASRVIRCAVAQDVTYDGAN
jgi:hypothetical protein